MERRGILRSEIISLHLSGDAVEIINIISSHKRESKTVSLSRKEQAVLYEEHGILDNGFISLTKCSKKTETSRITEAKTADENSSKIWTCPEEEKEWDPLILWFRPNLCCIDAIGCMLTEAGLNCISSVGCGSGLLEWLIAKLKGVEVVGYEVNETWWTSPYGPPRFIPHVYVDVGCEVPTIPSHHALFCCYFNNGPILQEYLDKYEGKCLIIIGSEDRSRRTDPRPLQFVLSKEWQLRHVHAQSSNDLVCCYIRNQEPTGSN